MLHYWLLIEQAYKHSVRPVRQLGLPILQWRRDPLPKYVHSLPSWNLFHRDWAYKQRQLCQMHRWDVLLDRWSQSGKYLHTLQRRDVLWHHWS